MPSFKKESIRTKNITHGMTGTPEYKAWDAMKGRCYRTTDKRFKDYGGRGITVYTEWRTSFVAFYNDIGKRPSERHSLDRINNNGNYEPSNCQWSLPKEQANNTRQNHYIILHGWKMNVTQWASFVGIKRGVILNRIIAGWPWAKAIFQPVDHPNLYTITLHSCTLTIKQWSIFVNISPDVIRNRIRRNWPPAKAIFKPVKHRSK